MKIAKKLTDKKFILIDKEVHHTDNSEVNKIVSTWKHTKTGLEIQKSNEFPSKFKTVNLRLLDLDLLVNETALINEEYYKFLIPR